MHKNDRKIIVVKNWQLFVGLIILTAQIIFAVGMKAAMQEDNSRRINALEQRHVVEWDTYQNEQAALRTQLDRVEKKVDELLLTKGKK